jgi:integrase
MPKVAKEMGALEVKRLVHPGLSHLPVSVAVGGVAGLQLQITPNGGRSWLLRATIGGRRREIGLGSFPEVTLAAARERAREAKAKIWNGSDPIAERKAQQAQLAAQAHRSLTFKQALDKYCDAKLDQFSTEKYRIQWRRALEQHALPTLGNMNVQDIEVQDVLRAVEPIWRTTTETASRVRARIEAVLSWATVAGHRKGDNPARWAGNLKELLPAPSKVSKSGNQPALHIEDAPRWFASLCQLEGMGSSALKFLTLTAARSGEVRGASWDEIDFEKALWVIPAERMKMDREHRVPLSNAAVKLLRALPRFEGNKLVFPAPRGGQLSDMTLSATMRRMHEADKTGFLDRANKRPAVPHGLRSTFRDWVAEKTNFPGDMAEIALAHKVANAVEASYRRGDMVEKRRAMMQAWADDLEAKQNSDSVVIQT